MKGVHATIAFMAGLWLLSMALTSVCRALPPDVAKPANFDEIKDLFDSYGSAIDSYGGTPTGRKTLLAKGDEATLALIELLKEKINARSFPYELSNLVIVLAYDQAIDKKRSAKLLAEVLPEKVEEWYEKWWIVETIKFLRQADPELAAQIARKAMKGEMSAVKYAAIKVLGEVGEFEDIQTLELFRVDWRVFTKSSGSLNEEPDSIDAAAVRSEAEIYKRILPGGE